MDDHAEQISLAKYANYVSDWLVSLHFLHSHKMFYFYEKIRYTIVFIWLITKMG